MVSARRIPFTIEANVDGPRYPIKRVRSLCVRMSCQCTARRRRASLTVILCAISFTLVSSTALLLGSLSSGPEADGNILTGQANGAVSFVGPTFGAVGNLARPSIAGGRKDGKKEELADNREGEKPLTTGNHTGNYTAALASEQVDLDDRAVDQEDGLVVSESPANGITGVSVKHHPPEIIYGDTEGQPSPFSLQISTEENHRNQRMDFHGPYAHIRSTLDYSYHSNYLPTRQNLQDTIVNHMMHRTYVRDSGTGRVCPRPSNPWIVFTAGAMGAGKTHTIRTLDRLGRFPLDSFVSVDPDEIRRHLPEFALYVEESGHPELAGNMTRKEAGYIAEILTLAALENGKNVLVDGSLRDADWYRRYFEQLRLDYKNLRIAILHITAPRDVVFRRAAERSRKTGRVVPHETLEMALMKVPESVKILAPLSDFFCELNNPSNSHEVELLSTCDGYAGKTKDRNDWRIFTEKWSQTCLDNDPIELILT